MLPIPVAARSKTLFCGHSVLGIVVSNPVGDGCRSLVSAVCYRVEVSAPDNNRLCTLIAEDFGGRPQHVACSVRCNNSVCLMTMYTFAFY
jgi:hypothetical protein